jgi:hypothetical protein
MTSRKNGRGRARNHAIRRRKRDRDLTWGHAEVEIKLELAALAAPERLPTAHCPSCRHGFLFLDVTPSCPRCGAAHWRSGADAAVQYAWVFLHLDRYSALTDGGDEPTQVCPDCGEDAVVTDEFPNGIPGLTGLCFQCTATYTARCSRCGGPAQDGDGVCSTCWSEIIGRD